MLPFDVGTIRVADLEALVEAKRAEDSGVEFKAQLPGTSDAERKEFLADVTSFANARGGVILYGIAASQDSQGRSTGIATALPGLPQLNADREIQRLEAMLRDAVDPPLTAQVRFQAISRTSEPPLLAIGIFRSFAGPHQVTFAGSHRFWLRGQTGKYEPDVTELRRLFLSAASWLKDADEARRHRLERLRSVPRLDPNSVTVVHILPLASADTLIDLRAHEGRLNSECPPLQHSGWSGRFNTDGYITYTLAADTRLTVSYTQWFRTGGVEGFSSQFVAERDFGSGTPVKVLWLRELKDAVLRWTPKALALLGGPLQVAPPFAVLLSLQRVQGARVPSSPSHLTSDGIDWDDLLLPPVLYEPGSDLADALQPLFDTVAQSAGLACAP